MRTRGDVKELLRTNDHVLLSYADATLRGAGIDSLILDAHTALAEGSIGAIQRRLVVADADHAAARELLEAALDASDKGSLRP